MDFHKDFHWSDDLSTAITFIDDEHQRLIERYHELVDALRRQIGVSRFLADIEKLAEDTQAHFLHEERVMRNIQYPDYSKHKAAHDRLTADFSDFIQNIGVGFSDDDLPALTEYFRYWFLSHVKEHDVKLKQYLDRPDEQSESVQRRA
jgi:hemerythrin